MITDRKKKAAINKKLKTLQTKLDKARRAAEAKTKLAQKLE